MDTDNLGLKEKCKIFEYFDYFGVSPNLRIYRRNTFQLKTGGIAFFWCLFL